MYTTTAIEDWINSLYARLNIYTPSDINIKRLAYRFTIFLHYKSMPARYDVYGRYRGIVLDCRTSPEEQREQFFHELCHILRHAGHQTMMPEAFRELQEWDAEKFVMYAALPYSMLINYDFNDEHLIQHLIDDFKITEELCIKRLKHIKRNTLNAALVAESKSMYNG